MPTVSHTTPAFGGSCTLDTNDEFTAVGNVNGGQVELYDLSDPSAPTKLGSVATGLFVIVGLSFDGTRVPAGEMNGLRAALAEVADPSTPKLVSLMAATPPAQRCRRVAPLIQDALFDPEGEATAPHEC
jgi:hypothetical protein